MKSIKKYLIDKFRQPKGEATTEDLFSAVEKNDLTTVRDLISRGASLTDQGLIRLSSSFYPWEAQGTALHLACFRFQESTAVAEYLIKKGAQIDQMGADKYGICPLHLASWFNKSPVLVQLLLKEGGDARAQDKDGRTPLHRAAQNKDVSAGVEISKVLIEAGAKVEASILWNKTPLCTAAFLNSSPALVEFLLSHGADKEARNDDEETALHVAVRNRNEHAGVAIARLLLKEGALVDPRNAYERTPLHMASEGHSSPAMVQLLLTHQAKKEVEDMVKDRPLHKAVQNEDPEAGAAIAQVLLEDGALVDPKDMTELTPLHAAARESRLAVTQVLLKWKADPDASGCDNWTPLHYAGWKNASSAVSQLLLDQGADPNSSDKDQNTALHILAKSNDEAAECVIDIANCLLRAGCNPLRKNSNGQMASDICTEKDKPELAAVIREYEMKLRL